jgi:hypothetical protein
MTKLEATIADLRIAVSLTTEPGECLDVPRERVTELLDEVERLREENRGLNAEMELHVEHEGHVRDVISEYTVDVESGEKYDALLALIDSAPADR